MQQSGTIYEIVEVDKDTIKIILNKRSFGKPYLSAVTYWGFWKNKALEQGIRPKDKIKTNVNVKSKEYNGKWYDSQVGRELYIVSKAPYKFDAKTGELFE
jgi:hypothetical protein